MCKVLSVVPVCVLVGVKELTGWNGSVVAVDEYPVCASLVGEVGTGEAVVELVVGSSGRINGVVVIPSTGPAFVEEVVAVLETVVLPLTADVSSDVSETRGETDLKVV